MKITKYGLAAIALCAFCLLVLPTPASADAIYAYTGQHFTTAIDGLTLTDFISGTIDLSSPLPSNATNQNVTALIVSYDFMTGSPALSATQLTTVPTFVVSTGPTGQLTAWGLIEQNVATGFVEFGITNGLNVCGPAGCQGVGPADIVSISNVTQIASNAGRPGTWTLVTAPVPEPSSLLLLGTSLLGLLGMRLKKKRLA